MTAFAADISFACRQTAACVAGYKITGDVIKTLSKMPPKFLFTSSRGELSYRLRFLLKTCAASTL